MASGDKLREILDLVRRELPDVPPELLSRMELLIRTNFGTERIYIAAHKKRSHLERLARAEQDAATDRLAQMLGVTERHIRRLRRLR